MVGNFMEVTAAPARMSASSGPQSESRSKAGLVPPAGKEVAVGGRSLPGLPAPEPAIDVERTIARLNELMSHKQRSLFFQVDVDSGRTVITVINEATGEIVRQIPSEEVLALVDHLERQGSLLDAWI
jgi:flagellar protein FlaG